MYKPLKGRVWNTSVEEGENNMSNVPMQLVVAAFIDMDGGKNALRELQELKDEKLIAIEDAAVLYRDYDSKLHISETADMTGTRGAVVGGVTGAVLGVIAGPVGWAALGGAAIGGLVAKLRDSGFPHERLEEWGERLGPGQSAIVALIEQVWLEDVERMLSKTAKEVMAVEVGNEIAEQLEPGKRPV
jgi:uncharacterized membrane protein